MLIETSELVVTSWELRYVGYKRDVKGEDKTSDRAVGY